jgi:nitrogen-specific signal transduction histidine kinase
LIVRSLLASLLVAFAVVVSACGGGDETSSATVAEYTASVSSARDRVDFALARITKATSQEEFLNRMDEAAAAIDAAASDLEDAGVAEGYDDETEQLTSALHQLSVDLEATAHDIAQPEFSGLVGDAQGLNFESWDKANLALAALIGDGIEVELIGRH